MTGLLDDFWHAYWQELAQFQADPPPERLRKSRSTARSAIPEDRPYRVAWTAHSMVTYRPFESVVLLEACCQLFVTNLNQSPLFPVLVQDALHALQLQPHDEALLLLLESLVPLIKGGDDETEDLTESVQEWTRLYHDDTYTSPLLPDATLVTDLDAVHDSPTEALLLSSIDMPFCRPPPPTLPNDELLWITPTNLRLMLIPDDDEADKDDDTQELFQQALTAPLAPNAQRRLLESSSQTVQGLTPQNLPRLVEHNPLIAHECLLRLLVQSNNNNDYLVALLGMDVTLHSLEVVHKLAPHLDAEYLHLYVANCIASCENVVARLSQNRLVRLLCILIQALLRNGSLHVDDVYYEVQAFCVEFSRIREAAALFQSLKK